jgi:hypothetical protein
MSINHLNFFMNQMYDRMANFYESHFNDKGAPLSPEELGGALSLCEEMINDLKEVAEVYGSSIPEEKQE